MRVTFDQYAAAYQAFAAMRLEDGILEIRLHKQGGPCVFDGPMHQGLGDMFADIGSDAAVRVVILTATGDRFLRATDMDLSVMEPFLPYTPALHLPLMPEGVRLLENFLKIEVPVIAAVNGPASVHAEVPVTADIVLASEDAYFSDEFHFINGVVPGDGVQLVWPMLLGIGRARYFLMTGQRIAAAEAHAIGFVNEVVPKSELLARAWALARELLEQPDVTLRATRMLFTQPFKKAINDDLAFGLALEGLGSVNHWPLRLRGAG
jgi:enoyl-CoA hydratase/carnithine racemase